MERAALEKYLAEGLSLAEIARRVGQDRSTIGKAAKRYGLTPAGREKYAAKPVDRGELETLIESEATVSEIATYFGVSVTTARKHLARHGLRTAHSEGLRAWRLAKANGELSRTMVCKTHGATRSSSMLTVRGDASRAGPRLSRGGAGG
jgi:IS30 family transposase